MPCKSFVVERNSAIKGRLFKDFKINMARFIFASHRLRTVRAGWICASRGLQIVVRTNKE